MRRAIAVALICFCFLSAAPPATAALSALMVWEIRPGVGSDNSGGGFVAGATGTDFSQQDAAQYSGTNLASTNGTTNPCIVTSATHNFVAADVGNLLHVTAGTNWIPNFFQIVSVAANAATLDRACGSAASISGGTFAVGGALNLPATAISATGRVGSNKIFVKATGTVTITADQTLNTAVTPSSTVPPNRIIGYTTTRTDKGRASVTLSTNTGLTAFNGTGITGWYIENFTINCSSLGTSTGIAITDDSLAVNVKISNCTTAGITFTTPNIVGLIDSEVTGCTSACTAAVNGGSQGIQVLRNWIHDNASPAIKGGVRSTIIFNLITNNTGASTDCLTAVSDASVILNNTIYGCGRDGIRITSNDLVNSMHIRNNLIVNSTGAGITGGAAAGTAAFSQFDGNAYFNNTGGNRVNMDDTTVNKVNGVAPYSNTLDVATITCDPFTNAAANNFTLNNSACGGALARYSGTPGPFSGNSFVGAIGQGTSQVGAQTNYAGYVQ